MKKILQGLFINVVSLWIIDHFSSSIAFADNWALFFTALALTLLNATVKPILKLISLPVTILTLGLFSLIINGAVLWLAFSMNEGSSIGSFGDAVWIAIVLAVLNSILGTFVGKDKKD
jgi:putative membrane protein